jgi:hypothetical protein
MWTKIFEIFERVGFKGRGLPIVCQEHNNKALPFTAAEFETASREGGCKEPCSFRFDCGHLCRKSCHGHGYIHKACSWPQYLTCPAGHVMTRDCGARGHATCMRCVQADRIQAELAEAKAHQEMLEAEQKATIELAKLQAAANLKQKQLELQMLESPQQVQVIMMMSWVSFIVIFCRNEFVPSSLRHRSKLSMR